MSKKTNLFFSTLLLIFLSFNIYAQEAKPQQEAEQKTEETNEADQTKGLTNLGNRVGNTFSLVFIILVYMSIGPFLAIPRAGSVPFEMAIAPYLPDSFSRPLALAIYTVVFLPLLAL